MPTFYGGGPGPAPKKPAPKAGMPNPMGFQSQLPANGQAVNRGSILQGLRHDSKVAANTGTKTGDQAVQDMAKSQLMQNQATAGRAADTTNAQFQSQQQKQQEQLTQQGRASRLQRYQQMTSQSVDQMNLANQLARQQLDLQTQWRTGLIGLLR
jgi:hypothetical protein